MIYVPTEEFETPKEMLERMLSLDNEMESKLGQGEYAILFQFNTVVNAAGQKTRYRIAALVTDRIDYPTVNAQINLWKSSALSPQQLAKEAQ
jgi:hypothetical protein